LLLQNSDLDHIGAHAVPTRTVPQTNEKSVLKETFAKANLPAEIEVYDGAAHGWCPPDSGVYNEPQAEKAWSRLLAMYGKALA
jgi:carboxymethylenebutenolidase